MSYSDKNPAWNNMHKSAHDAHIQWEAQRAAELTKADPTMTRDTALKQAAREFDAKQQY